ncbi:unnamed protein product, partial [Prorocentrum cordatum]
GRKTERGRREAGPAALARPPLPRAAPGRPPKLTRAAWLASRAPPPMRAPPPRLWLAAGVAAACCGRARASGAGAGDPLDGARQAVAGRLRRLQAQQAVEAGPAALCVSQKAECARNIARSVDMYRREMEALVRGCASAPESHEARAQRRQDQLDGLHEAHRLLR